VVSDSTQCSIAAVKALEAGGVKLTGYTGLVLLPSTVDEKMVNSQTVKGNDIKKLQNALADALGFSSVKVNADGTITGRGTPTGSHINRQVNCDQSGHCK
jgi:hypothetical protein